MLQFLKISNLALLESASIDFSEGFTVVTGETGAGKSVLLGALGLLSGARTDKTLIRSGCELCEVEASLWFESSAAVDKLLGELGLPACEEGVLLLKRSLHASRPSRISVNGSLATLSNLQALGERWIDFHGPGEPQRLLTADCQRELIDLYGDLAEEALAFREAYDAWRKTLAEIVRLRGQEQLAPDQVAFIESQLAAVDALQPSEESIEALERDFSRVSSAQELMELTGGLGMGLSGEGGAADRLSALVRNAAEASELDASLGELAGRLEGLVVEARELGAEYERIGASLHFEPEFAEEVAERMNAWQELSRRYGGSVASVVAARQEMAQRLDSQGDVAGSIERLTAEAEAQEAALAQQAAGLSKRRLAAGKALAKRTESALLELGFKKGRCDLALRKSDSLRSFGDASPELQFSPNVGEPLKPLSAVASSGELARVMLALKTILADVDSVPVLVFDEVDANVGGEIGRTVGRKLEGIGAGHQVICVTHLPQVASLGRQHFVVEKDQSGDRALVRIRPLETESEERVEELARMLGDRRAASALSHARELLSD